MPPRDTPWKGKCPNCGIRWNIRRDHLRGDDESEKRFAPVEQGQVVHLDDVTPADMTRISTGLVGVDSILGMDTREGGISGFAAEAGHIIQIYGSPGSGKSTLLLQMSKGVTRQRHDVLYFIGEEAAEQVKSRADRIGKFNHSMRLANIMDLDTIVDTIEEYHPKVCIIDSVNTVEVDEYQAGSDAAVLIAARTISKVAKAHQVALFLVVQITKAEDFSGPKSLEHLVDTSLYLKNWKHRDRRQLECSSKNRFGKTPTYAYFDMTEKGLIESSDTEDDDEDENKEEEKISIPVVIESAPVTRTKPSLKSVPLELPAPSAPDAIAPANFWVAPDGTSATAVLAISCDVDGCKGSKGRACTSSSGVREAGFHQVRVSRAKLGEVAPQVAEAIADDPGPPDLFAKKKFGAPPKVKAKAAKKKPKKKPAPTVEA